MKYSMYMPEYFLHLYIMYGTPSMKVYIKDGTHKLGQLKNREKSSLDGEFKNPHTSSNHVW